MPSSSRDRALILRRHAFGESSLTLQVFTRSAGRVHFIAKGAYRAKSAYSGVLDLFDTLELGWQVNPRSELQNLRTAKLLVRRRQVSRELGRYRAALAVLELLDKGARPDHPDRALFDLGEGALSRLAVPTSQPFLELLAFDLRFLGAMGLAPSLEVCAICGGPAPPSGERPPRVPFSAAAGGRLCPPHAREWRASGSRVGTLRLGVVRVASDILRAEPGTLDRTRLDGTLRTDVRRFVDRFLEFHLETRLRSRSGSGRPGSDRRARGGYQSPVRPHPLRTPSTE